MNNFKDIKKHAERTRQLSNQVTDQFLIYYAASKDHLDKIFEKKVRRYRHIFTEMPKEWKGFLETQFIAYEIFKSGGLIRKYLKHAEVNFRSDRELQYLKLQKDHPWRYSFSEIRDNPHPDFYTMHDIFTGQEYLLYSQGMSSILLTNPDIRTWFNLIGFDGKCMQTYGTIEYFSSFNRRDIVFYAHQLDPALKTDTDIVEHIEKDPISYSMLWSGAMLPAVKHKSHIIKETAARYLDDNFTSEPFKGRFRVEYAEHVYRLSLKAWDEFPHYAVAYYDEEEKTLHLTAMTLKGFEELVKNINACGYNLPTEPQDVVNPLMFTLVSDILGREVTTNPFEAYFSPDDDDNEDLEDMNHYLRLLMDEVNSDKKPDIRQLADEAGIDYTIAADITEQILSKLKW